MQNSSTRPRRRGRVRALLSLGMLVGLAQVGTLAAWTDTAAVESGSFTTGTLDLTVGETTAGQLDGPGGSWTHSALTLSDMAPGESVARLLTVGNDGSIPLTFTGTVATSTAALSGTNGLEVTVVQRATGVANSGSAASADRAGTCTGGTATSVNSTAVGTTPTAIHDKAVALASGASTTYCVIVALPSEAPNSLQGKTTSILFSFEAEQ